MSDRVDGPGPGGGGGDGGAEQAAADQFDVVVGAVLSAAGGGGGGFGGSADADPMVASLLAAYRPAEVPATVLSRVAAVVGPVGAGGSSGARAQGARAAAGRGSPAAASAGPGRVPRWPAGSAWRPVRAVALVLGVAFLGHAFGQLFLGHWVARQTHGTYDAHSYTEGGLAMLGLAGLVLAAVWRPRWLGVAAAVGGPVGVGFAVHGASEITGLTWGGALHGSEGVAGLALLLLCWRAIRYANPATDEEPT